jgi:CAAX prenyl protease-like protein
MNLNSDQSIRPTLAFVLPFVVYMMIASRFPSAEDFDDPRAAWQYTWMVAAQVAIAVGWLIYFRKIYLQHFPLRFSLLSVAVGFVGVVLWIGICHLQIEQGLLGTVGLERWAARPSFNPYESLPDAGARNLFLVLRFTLLALIVPIVEELFLRGWLVRWMHDPNWEQVSLRNLSRMALLTPSIYGVLTHPSEAIAAFVWFGLVTWLMVRTGNLWDCVVAHAVTNLLLGIYVIQSSSWHLW